MTSPRAIITLSALAVLLIVSAFGPSISMPMDAKGHMPNCPFSLSTVSICPMNFLQHIGYWQQLFTSTLPVDTAVTLLTLFTIIVFAILSKGLSGDVLRKAESTRFRIKSNARLKTFDPILSLFSDGILNSKIYAFSR